MWQILRASARIYAAIMRALMHLATTAWLACHPLRCVLAPRLAYSDRAAGKRSPHPPRLAIVMPADVPLWKVNRRRPHVDELNRARKGPVFFWERTTEDGRRTTEKRAACIDAISSLIRPPSSVLCCPISHENIHPRRLPRYLAHPALLRKAQGPRRHHLERSCPGHRCDGRTAARHRSAGADPRAHENPQRPA